MVSMEKHLPEIQRGGFWLIRLELSEVAMTGGPGTREFSILLTGDVLVFRRFLSVKSAEMNNGLT